MGEVGSGGGARGAEGWDGGFVDGGEERAFAGLREGAKAEREGGARIGIRTGRARVVAKVVGFGRGRSNDEEWIGVGV